MVRRRREAVEGLPLPPHLAAASAWDDPDVWKRERFKWARKHAWPPGKIGFLEFFAETTGLYRQAKQTNYRK